MPANNPVAASRFGISIDGVQIASFTELQGISTNVGVPESRQIGAHELSHVVARSRRRKQLSFKVTRLSASPDSMLKLKYVKGRRVAITAFDSKGTRVSSFVGLATGGGTDVLQQEWSITYETIQRVL